MLLGILSHLVFWVLHVSDGSSFPRPLSVKDEKKYFEAMKNGDMTARGLLIEHNLRLVAHIIKKYYASSVNQDDLVSIGTIGLIKAVDSFDATKKIRLSSYASRCIENEVLMHFRGTKKTAQDVSMSDPIDTDLNGNTLSLIDVLTDEDSLIDDIDTKIQGEKLHECMSEALEGREIEIVRMRYGLCGEVPATQREVSKKLGISRSYVSRIEKRALGSLRKRLSEKGDF